MTWMITAMMGWTLWLGHSDGTWYKGGDYTSWLMCDEAGRQAKVSYGWASPMFGASYSRPAPYVCAKVTEHGA